MPDLRVIGVTNMDLFATRCPCGEVTVHGFWTDLNKAEDPANKRVTVTLRCDGCGTVRTRRYRLTTGRARRHRLVPWARWFLLSGFGWWAVSRLPARRRELYFAIIMWLERRLPL